MQKSLNKKLHKVNSDLAVLYGYLQLLEKKIPTIKDEKEILWIQKALESCRKLQEQVKELDKEKDA